MKVNLKKLGAIVAGATILASSVAFAGLYFQNTQLVNDNGAPQVKVVVGEKAAASDGVAAANIAAKVASEAFKTSALTASVKGTATYAGGAAGSTVTLSDKACKLEITVPDSATPGTYTWQNLLGDNVNRVLQDRGEDTTDYDLGTDDLADDAHPFTSGDAGIAFSGDLSDDLDLYRISNTEFDALKMPSTYSKVKDESAGKQYTETQDLWIQGDDTFVSYSNADDDLVSDFGGLAYTIKFDGPGSENLGIPVCTKMNDAGEDDDDWTQCADADETAAHKVKIMFLGSKWVISEMSGPGHDEDSDTEDWISEGGSITLAVESVGGVVKKTEALEVDGYKFTLDDVEVAGTSVSAAITVYDAAGNEKTKKKIGETDTEDVVVGGKTYRVHVYQAVGGLTWAATWADMAVYAKEMKLEDGETLTSEGNDGWKVYLGWKNKDAVDSGTDAVETPDHLRTIVLTTDDVSDATNTGEDELAKNDYVDLPTKDAVWRLSYDGLNLVSSDYDTLKFKLIDDTKDINDITDDDGDTGDCTLANPYVEVTTSTDKGFKLTGATFTGGIVGGADAGPAGTAYYNKFYVSTEAATCGATIAEYAQIGTVFMKRSPTIDGYYAAGPEDDDAGADEADAFLDVEYAAIDSNPEEDTLGRLNTGGGLIRIIYDDFADGSALDGVLIFAISERAGTGISNDYNDVIAFQLDDTDGAESFDFDNLARTDWITADDEDLNSDEDEVDYVREGGPVGYSVGDMEEGFITERGSVFKSIADDVVQFSMAKKLGKAKYTVKTLANGTSVTSAIQQTLKEGESYTSGGFKVKVLEVQATGTCAAAAGAAPSCDMSGVSAVIMPNNAATVDAAVPYVYGSYAPLVKLDKDAVGTEAIVTVGGPAVNTVTKEVLSGADFTAAAVNGKVVKEVVAGKKIVVAGVTADDTLAAAADFITQLKKQ